MTCARLAPRRTRSLLVLAAAAACVAATSPAHALSLLDLKTEGFTAVSDGVEFSGFRVKVKGLGLNDALSSHEVVFEDGGIQIELAHGFQNKKAKVKLKYVASALEGGLTDALLDPAPGSGRIKVKTRIKGVGKLAFSSKKPDEAILGLALGEIDAVKVKTAMKLKTGDDAPYIDRVVTSSYDVNAMNAPEPSTAALFALGLAGLAAARRRRRA